MPSPSVRFHRKSQGLHQAIDNQGIYRTVEELAGDDNQHIELQYNGTTYSTDDLPLGIEFEEDGNDATPNDNRENLPADNSSVYEETLPGPAGNEDASIQGDELIPDGEAATPIEDENEIGPGIKNDETVNMFRQEVGQRTTPSALTLGIGPRMIPMPLSIDWTIGINHRSPHNSRKDDQRTLTPMITKSEPL